MNGEPRSTRKYFDGDCLRLRREGMRMNQDDLALKVGVSRSQISLWEHGRAQPHAGNVLMLAEALLTTPEAFYRTAVLESANVDSERVAYLASKLTLLEARAPGVIAALIATVEAILSARAEPEPASGTDFSSLYACLNQCLPNLPPGSDAARAVRTALDKLQPLVEAQGVEEAVPATPNGRTAGKSACATSLP
jgi:transcriptional regulator with XRE-family HTH domain